MSKELVIASNRHETKVAVLEEDQLTEIYFQRANEYSLAGSIHKGRVTRVLPGMQSAFVDLGLERDTFLYVSDFFEENEDFDSLGDDKPARSERRERGSGRSGGEQKPSGEQRSVERPQVGGAAAPVPQVSAAEVEEGADLGDVAETEIATVAETEAARPPASAENGDRDRFRGDRRGRRSRRRRSRGRGFPENKYAQPTDVQSRDISRESEPEVDAAVESEVIVLPGESLAKYRKADASGHAPETANEPNSSDALEQSESVEREEEIEAEAEELELADKIFSHHDQLSIEDEESKIEEVKQDQPVSEFLVEDIEVEDAPDAEAQVEPESLDAVSERKIEAIEERLTALEVEEERRAVDEDIEVAAARAYLTSGIEPVDDQAESRFLAIEDFRSEEPELLTSGPEILANTEGGESSPEAPGTEQTQSATVREPGNRFLHRASRRMRRRRGGSRFQAQEQTGGAAPEYSGARAAAAPAVEARGSSTEERAVEAPERVMPSIADLLKPGQEIIVQIAKEPLGQKGARITSHVALPGRYVVFMPSVSHLGVSRKIASDEERQRLKKILQAHRVGTTGGFIVRTAGEGVPEDEIAADMDFLYKLWLDIRSKAEKKPAPALLHYDLDIVQRILRDQLTEDFKAIWVDNEELYENVLTFMQRFQPTLVSRVKMYTRSAPIFDAFNITQELEKALRPKVWLKSGGYIVINQTEALVAIDINTGKYVGKSNRLEDTIVKTNLEAVKEIVRQIRLRDLGGIIVVDFIDMDERKNRQRVMQALEEAMQVDRAPYKILQFNDFGLVAITRKRVKQSLERTLCAPCPACEGAGYVKSVPTVIGEILVEAQKIAKALEGKDVVLRAHPEVAKVLKASSNHYLEELEEILGRPVLVTGDPTLLSDKFDLG